MPKEASRPLKTEHVYAPYDAAVGKSDFIPCSSSSMPTKRSNPKARGRVRRKKVSMTASPGAATSVCMARSHAQFLCLVEHASHVCCPVPGLDPRPEIDLLFFLGRYTKSNNTRPKGDDYATFAAFRDRTPKAISGELLFISADAVAAVISACTLFHCCRRPCPTSSVLKTIWQACKTSQ